MHSVPAIGFGLARERNSAERMDRGTVVDRRQTFEFIATTNDADVSSFAIKLLFLKREPARPVYGRCDLQNHANDLTSAFYAHYLWPFSKKTYLLTSLDDPINQRGIAGAFIFDLVWFGLVIFFPLFSSSTFLYGR